MEKNNSKTEFYRLLRVAIVKIKYILYKMFEILDLKKSNKKGKRFDAIVKQDNKQYKVSFGSSDYKSYPYHKDKKRKIAFFKRQLHTLNKNFSKISPAILAFGILWSFKSIKKSFNYLNKQLKNLEKGISFKTDPELYEMIKKKIKTANDGKWNARLSQKLSREYKKEFINMYGKNQPYINFKNEKKK